MSKRRQPVIEDSELLELFADDSEGLAIVDAIVATAPGRSRSTGMRASRVVAAALALAAVAAVVITRPSQAGVVKSALHALDAGAVVRLEFVEQRPGGTIMNLKTNETHAVRHIVDVWYSPNFGKQRVRDRFLGAVVTDAASSVGGASSDEVAAFPASYREALETGHVTTAEAQSPQRSKVYVLAFTDLRRRHVRVVLSARSYKPLRIVFGGGRQFVVRRLENAARSDLKPVPQAEATPTLKLVHLRPSVRGVAIKFGLPVRAGQTEVSRTRLLTLVGRRRHSLHAYELTYTGMKDRRLRGAVRVTVSTRMAKALGWRSPYNHLANGHALILRGLPGRAFARRGALYYTFDSTASTLSLSDFIQALFRQP